MKKNLNKFVKKTTLKILNKRDTSQIWGGGGGGPVTLDSPPPLDPPHHSLY